MKKRELWERYRAWLFDDPDLGFRLDISRIGLPSDYLKTMEGKMAGALDAMEELEAGGIANPDENRMVGHYWLRAPELAPTNAIAGEIDSAIQAVEEFTAEIRDGGVRPPHAERFTRFLLIGIGGSALGPQFVADALDYGSNVLEPHFLDNTDPDGFERVLGNLGEALAETLTIVVSKSGGTPETRNGMLEAAAAYQALGLEIGDHAVAVTQEGSMLAEYAGEHSFLRLFPVWDWVGGRTSVMSPAGLLPAALQGVDVRELLGGAMAMDRVTRNRLILSNPAALLALSWFHAGEGRGARDMVILPYKDRLALFGRYLQQLIMESLGKELDLDGNTVHQGIAVYGNKGSTDQHAYVQQLRDGIPNFHVTFIEVLRDREGGQLEVEPEVTSGDFLSGFLLGTRQALQESDRPSLTITLDRIDARTTGVLIALYERAVGLYASLIGINAYHQPGVEAGKKAAASILLIQRKLLAALRGGSEDGGTCEELAKAIDAPDDIEMVFKILEHMSANRGHRVVRTPGATPFDAVYRYQLE